MIYYYNTVPEDDVPLLQEVERFILVYHTSTLLLITVTTVLCSDTRSDLTYVPLITKHYGDN